MPDFALIIIRSIIAFVILFLLTRLMGSKQLSQLTFFDYVVGITIGSIAATMSVDKNVQIMNGVISLAIWGFVPVLLALFGMKSRKFLRATDGIPTIVIKNGQVLEKAMAKNLLAIEELMMLLREKDIFLLADVEIAIYETNGQLSVLKKTDVSPVTPKQLGLTVQLEKMPSILIVDGEILYENLSAIGQTEEWLNKQLLKKGYADAKAVFLAQVDSQGNLFIDGYQDQ